MKQFLRNLLENQLYKNAYSRAFFSLLGIVFKEVRVSFRQFFSWRYPVLSSFKIIGVISSSAIRLLLGRSVRYSFAHTGEDRILEGLLKPLITKNGFYVEVGCNHPILFSNTYGLYRKGWTGICVDANPALKEKFNRLRPRDRFILALVSDTSSEREFYIIQNDVLSTTEKNNKEAAANQGLTFNTIKYFPQSLTSILDKHNAPQEFDLLSIDAEEHDYHVLRSLDFSKYKPQVIIIEDETYSFDESASNAIVDFMGRNGYVLVGFILKNLYFQRQ